MSTTTGRRKPTSKCIRIFCCSCSSWSWYTASSGGTKISTTTVVTKDITYYAQWSINSYTLTFNPNGGTVTPTSKDLEYNSAYGTLPTPTRASDAQYTYTFAGWYTAATGGTQVTAATKMAAKDTTVYAHWTSNTRSYTVSYQTTYGTLNRTSQSVAYNSKGSCTLTMPDNTAEFIYTFVGWYTAANGGGKELLLIMLMLLEVLNLTLILSMQMEVEL